MKHSQGLSVAMRAYRTYLETNREDITVGEFEAKVDIVQGYVYVRRSGQMRAFQIKRSWEN